MKIQTNRKGWFGQTVGIGGHKIEFNGSGVAEVSDEVAFEITKKYNTMVYLFGKLPQREETEKNKVEEPEIKALLEQIDALKLQNSDQKEQYEKKIAILEDEVNGWKKEFEDLKLESKEVVKQAISDKEFNALADLIEQNVNDLKKFAVDKLGFEQATVEPLRKPQLIVEIFKAIINADNV